MAFASIFLPRVIFGGGIVGCCIAREALAAQNNTGLSHERSLGSVDKRQPEFDDGDGYEAAEGLGGFVASRGDASPIL